MKMNSGSGALWRALSTTLLSIALLSSSVFGWQQQGAAPQSTATLSAAEQEASASVKVETIKEVTSALSAEEMQGRGTMQPGGDKAASYIADRFAKLGLKPLGDKNTYLQTVKFREMNFLPETALKVGDTTLQMGKDFYVGWPYSGDKNVSGEMVFVAYALTPDMSRRNDLSGVDVKGKIVVLMEGPPASVSKSIWTDEIQFQLKLALVKRGAAGLVFVGNGREPEHPYSEMADYLTRRQLSSADTEELPSYLPPFVAVSDQAAEKLFAGSGVSLAEAQQKAENNSFTPINLKKSAKITVRLKKSKGASSNVVGLLEGSDPKLKAEALVYSAHYDAYGVEGNKVYHGAADNALGVAEMIAVAEAFMKSPVKPRRSIIFLAVTGEEYGGLGSEYWAANPTWKIKQVAADLNLDGMGTEVYGPVKTIVGFGAEHSNLGMLLNEVAAASGLKVIPDPMPSEKAFYRSDHYLFVKKGVPALMLLGAPEGDTATWVERMKAWEKTDYHQPGDVIRPDWNWEGPRTMAVLGLVMGLRLTNGEQMPAWLSSSPYNRERGTKEPAPPEQ